MIVGHGGSSEHELPYYHLRHLVRPGLTACVEHRAILSGILLSSHASLPDVAVRELLHARIHGMPVLELADYYEQYWSRVPVTHLQGEWFALSRGFDLLHSPIQTQLKRASDLLLAGGLLICASPIMLVVALAVKLDSRGTILFKQTRVGRYGAEFTCLKFRSMRVRQASFPLGAFENATSTFRFSRWLRSFQ